MTHPQRAVLIAILLGAFALRIAFIGELPPGFGHDEAQYAAYAQDILNGDVRAYYTDNTGREPLFMAAAAPFVLVLGHDPLAVRLPAVFFGILFIPATYAFLRRVLGSTETNAAWIALCGAALAAGSLWLEIENRIGWRANTLPFVLAVAGYWYWRARTSKELGPWTALGLAFGLAQYSYAVVRAFPPIVPGFSLIESLWTRSPRNFLDYRKQWLSFAGAAILTVSPILLFALTNSGAFFSQQNRLLSDDDYRIVLPEHSSFARRLAGTLLMFFVSGDQYVFHNVPGRPVFDWLIAPAFILGIAYFVFRIRRLPYLFMLYWLTLSILAAALPEDAAPHYLHASAILPALFAFPAVVLVRLVFAFSRRPAARLAAAIGVGALVLGSVAVTAYSYFGLWKSYPGLDFAFDSDMVELANALNDRGGEADIGFVIPIGPGYQTGYVHPTLDFLYTGRAPLLFLRMEEDKVLPSLLERLKNKRKVLVVERTQDRMAPPDNKEILPYYLLSRGERVDEESRRSFRLIEYELDEPLAVAAQPPLVPVDAAFGGIVRIGEYRAGQGVRSDTVQVELRWRLEQATRLDLKASVRLLDASGKALAQSDRDLLQAPGFEPTSGWEPGDTEATYHLLELPPGAPAGRYQLAVVVYERRTGRPYDPSTGRPLFTGDTPELRFGPLNLTKRAGD